MYYYIPRDSDSAPDCVPAERLGCCCLLLTVWLCVDNHHTIASICDSEEHFLLRNALDRGVPVDTVLVDCVDQARATVGLASELAVAATAVPAETADVIAMARALAPVDVGVDLLCTVAAPIQCTHEDITHDRVVMLPLRPTERACTCSGACTATVLIVVVSVELPIAVDELVCTLRTAVNLHNQVDLQSHYTIINYTGIVLFLPVCIVRLSCARS